jgi:hypothetical protein
MLKKRGPAFITALRVGSASKLEEATDGEPTLGDVAQRLQSIVEEAERVKVPLFLGKRASDVFGEALKFGAPKPSVNAVVNVWASPSSQ